MCKACPCHGVIMVAWLFRRCQNRRPRTCFHDHVKARVSMLSFRHPFDVRIPFITSLQLCDAPENIEISLCIKCDANKSQSPECMLYLLPRYCDIIMNAMASQITGVSIVCWAVSSGAGQARHQSSASLAFVRGIHRWPVNSPHKGPVTWKMLPLDDVIMWL